MTRRAFVVLEHTLAPDDVHYDLMFEEGEVLVTFQLEAPPAAAGVRGRRSFDHRRHYLSYEGPISPGPDTGSGARDRGHVRAWDRGEAEDLAGAPRAGEYRVRLRGERLSGEWTLRADAEDRVLLAAGG